MLLKYTNALSVIIQKFGYYFFLFKYIPSPNTLSWMYIWQSPELPKLTLKGFASWNHGFRKMILIFQINRVYIIRS